MAFHNINVNATIKTRPKGRGGFTEDASALDVALQNGKFEAAELLIENVAQTTKVASFSLRKTGFALCIMLTSVLGDEFEFDVVEKPITEIVAREREYVENWISERSKTVLTLKELAALQVRRQASRQELNQLISDIEIPEDIQDILFLKCFKSDFEVVETDESETSDSDTSSSENSTDGEEEAGSDDDSDA